MILSTTRARRRPLPPKRRTTTRTNNVASTTRTTTVVFLISSSSILFAWCCCLYYGTSPTTTASRRTRAHTNSRCCDAFKFPSPLQSHYHSYHSGTAAKPISSFFVTPSKSHPSSSRSSTRRNSSNYNDDANNAGEEEYYVDINENAYRDIPNFEEWAYTMCGVQKVEGLELMVEEVTETNDGTYREDNIAFMTAVDLPVNTPILYVPSDMILSSQTAYEEFNSSTNGGAVLEDVEKVLTSLNAESQLRHYYLMLKIVVEWEKGTRSPWYAWLNSLPRYFSNAASMTPFCYTCLPTLLAKLAMQERANMNHLTGGGTKRHIPFVHVETKGYVELWNWAYQIVYTRAVEVESRTSTTTPTQDLQIIPVADYFNHGTDIDVVMEYDDGGNLSVYAGRDVPAQTPLRMSYGDPTNPSYLFARYGFLDQSSPATFCKINIPHVNSELRQLGYEHNRMLFYKDTGEVSAEVWDVLLYQLLSSTNIAKKRQLMTAHIEEDYETKSLLHEAYYPETSARLLDHIDTFLQHLEDLSSKSSQQDITVHPRLPLILQHNEFVKETFLAVRQRYFG